MNHVPGVLTGSAHSEFGRAGSGGPTRPQLSCDIGAGGGGGGGGPAEQPTLGLGFLCVPGGTLRNVFLWSLVRLMLVFCLGFRKNVFFE